MLYLSHLGDCLPSSMSNGVNRSLQTDKSQWRSVYIPVPRSDVSGPESPLFLGFRGLVVRLHARVEPRRW